MPTDFAEYATNIQTESRKGEITFSPSLFANTQIFTDLQGFALKLQDLILMEPGTNPNAITMGIGIRNYLFEFIDDETLSVLNREVNEQQQKFLPSDLVKSIEFYRNPNNASDNMLQVFIFINNIDGNYVNNYFAIGISKSTNKNTSLLSQVYI